MSILSSCAKALAFVLRLVKIAFVAFVLTVAFILGAMFNQSTSRLWHSIQAMCYVEGAVVVACSRNEDENGYVWSIVAIKNEGRIGEEVVFITHKVGKMEYQYAF